MKPKTIAQYFISKWLEMNFHVSNLTVEYISPNKAKITDRNGEVGYVQYEDGNVIPDFGGYYAE